jgi:DNA gyrase subunit A
MRMPLVYGHGNFGSLDDGPAAARYTECTLDWGGMLMLEDLKEDTVDWMWNYSNERQEPMALPSAFPNLIVNGGTGIAVGMASNMIPHNVVETISGLKAMIKNPALTLDELMTHIPGPDLPSGATIIDGGAIKEAYETGRGIVKMRGDAHFEDITARKRGIVFTTLPFNIGPEKVIAKIKEQRSAGKLLGVTDVKDLSDMKQGFKMLIEVKTGFNPQAVLEELYKTTPLEESFGINNVCLVDMQPRTLGMLDLCRHYLKHRHSVVRRRTEFRLKKAEARAHIVEGLVTAQENIDDVVALIRKAKDTATAHAALVKKYALSDLQTEAILNMRLSKLTSLEVSSLKKELKELHTEIAGHKKLLSSDANINAQVEYELDVVSAKYGDKRKSKILKNTPTTPVSASVEIADEPTTVVLTTSGLVGRFEPGAHKGAVTKNDLVLSQVSSSTRSSVGAVTSKGRLLRIDAVEIAKAEGKDRGHAASEYFPVEDGERIVSLVSLSDTLVHSMVTSQGLVKRVLGSALPPASKPGAPVIGLKDGDELVGLVSSPAEEELDLVIVTSGAQLLRTAAGTIAPKGAPAGGMAGVKLGDGARVIALGALAPTGDDVEVHSVSDAGSWKATPALDYPAKGRGGAGVRMQTFKKGETALLAAWVGASATGLGPAGEVVKLPAERAKRDASGTELEKPVAGFARTRA